MLKGNSFGQSNPIIESIKTDCLNNLILVSKILHSLSILKIIKTVFFQQDCVDK